MMADGQLLDSVRRLSRRFVGRTAIRVVDSWGYRTKGNPAGASDTPSFRVIDGYAYPTLSMPEDAPTLEVIGSFVYAPRGTAWFRIEQRSAKQALFAAPPVANLGALCGRG